MIKFINQYVGNIIFNIIIIKKIEIKNYCYFSMIKIFKNGILYKT